ncbi:hypothetical protein LEP1GSC150_3891 [Leptospira interrogans serovar Copenhageni str. LT2050]|uniref:Uncharacterized protein n=1 Tax=Leptospira interrogans serovar Copenhageni str. LT2050 TaxID=1001598 RepID=M3HH56_LEPIT|nr:hypothetical protein LEP1GSC150_3891 [Leptospira interrogans serovar Copenhageni str. LT2050]
MQKTIVFRFPIDFGKSLLRILGFFYLIELKHFLKNENKINSTFITILK